MMLCARNQRFANMRDEEDIFQTNLERCSYRFLQQTAKAMGLPSNVKKVSLIQLINTKNYSSPRDLDILVRHIRMEQQHRSMVRKMSPTNNARRKKINAQQSPEISSTNNGLSPPISKTPKRMSHIYIQQTVSARRLPITRSDRVLRSSNRVTKPSYLLNNTLLTLLKGPDLDKRRETKIKIVSVDENKKKVASRAFAKKIIESWQDKGKLASVQRSADMSPPLGKRVRRLSGVYSLKPEEIKLPSVEVRRADGSISKIKAIIQKPLPQHNYYDRQTQTENTNRSLLRPNTSRPVMSSQNLSHVSTNSSDETTLSNTSQDSIQQNGEYYHKRLRAEQIRSARRSRDMSQPASGAGNECRLPRINEVFSSFNGVYNRALTQPLYVQVDSEHEIAPIRPQIPEPRCQYQGSSSLETIYNLKMPYQHTVQAPTTNTHTVYCTQVISTAKALPSSTGPVHSYNVAMLPHENQTFYTNGSEVVPRTPNYEVVRRAPNYEVVRRAPNYEVEPRAPNHEVVPRANDYEVVPRANDYELVLRTNDYEVVPRANDNEMVPRANNYELVSRANDYEAVSRANDYEAVPRANDYEVVSRANDFYSNFHCRVQNNIDAPTLDFQRSCSSVETMTSQEQEQGANVTIPEMLEDAMEIISQDGDYIERMGMDIRMRCILCNWAGPKIILEYHIRKDHPKEIVECESNEFSASYTLGGLSSRRLWLSQVLQLCGELYVLSAKYDDPDCFMAALSTVSYNPDDTKTASLTIYNKVTGEPFTWKGLVTDLPPSMPYDNDPNNCFRLQLSKMDLLPNSANLKLLNRELVTRSPTKAIVGQPELDNIHITLSVKIFD